MTYDFRNILLSVQIHRDYNRLVDGLKNYCTLSVH